MKMFDHHKSTRKAWLKMEAKRQKAIERLGNKWVLSKDNPDRPTKGFYNSMGMRVA